MKKRFWIVLIIITIAALSVATRLSHRRTITPTALPNGVQMTNQVTTSAVTDHQRAAPVIPTVVTSANGQTFTIYSNRLQNPTDARRDIESHNMPISFYGRVIDQYSNALSGVQVKAAIRHWTALDEAGLGVGSTEINVERVTDIDGRFQVDGQTGDGLDIESFTKQNYEVEPGQSSFGSSSGSFEQPVVFKMWSNNVHEKLIGGKKAFHIVPDGRPYFINLNNCTISEENGSGDLKVWIQYTNQITEGQIYDWSAGITIIHGGLIEEPLASAMYMAPSDGYTPAFSLHQRIKGGQQGQTGTRQFYFTVQNGQTYGEMSIDLCAPFNDRVPGLVRISYAVNPSGSRILR